MRRIGFIGVGNMGGPMCRNLIRSGYPMVVHDLNQEAVKRCTALGASGAKSPGEVAGRSDVVFTSLPDSPDVRKVVLEPGGIVEGAHEGLIYVDLSTNLPSFVKTLAQKLSLHGISMLEAPILGSPSEVDEKEAVIVTGGGSETFEKVKPLLESCFRQVLYAGSHGAATTAKLVNNYLTYCTLAVAKEGMMLGVKGGLRPEDLLQILKACRGDSPLVQSIALAVESGKYRPEYEMDLSFFKTSSSGLTGKSLKMALDLADSLGIPLLFGSLLVNLLRQTRGIRGS